MFTHLPCDLLDLSPPRTAVLRALLVGLLLFLGFSPTFAPHQAKEYNMSHWELFQKVIRSFRMKEQFYWNLRFFLKTVILRPRLLIMHSLFPRSAVNHWTLLLTHKNPLLLSQRSACLFFKPVSVKYRYYRFRGRSLFQTSKLSFSSVLILQGSNTLHSPIRLDWWKQNHFSHRQAEGKDGHSLLTTKKLNEATHLFHSPIQSLPFSFVN